MTTMQHPELDLPPGWARLVMPRRGGRTQPEPINFDTEAADRIDRLVREHFAFVESFFPPFFTDLTLRNATAGHLSTGPDPTGAAVLHLILGHLVTEEHRFGPFLDAWITKHGPAFAAAAVLERCMMTSGYTMIGDNRRVTVDEPGGLKWAARIHREDLRRIRTAIASTNDYDAVIEALAERRSSPWRSTVASFLVPTETNWVSEALEADFPDWFTVDWMWWHAVSTTDHLAALERRSDWPIRGDTGMLATFLDACGVAGLPVLAASAPGWGWEPAARPDVATALTAAESPEALRRLLSHLEVRGTIPLAGAVVRRYPAMAVRTIAAHTAESGPSPELAALLPSDPLVWRAIATELSASDMAATDTMREVGPDTPVADPADLPPLLTDPPWLHRDQAPESPAPVTTDAPADLELRWRAREEPNPTYTDPAAMLEELVNRPDLGERLLPMAGLRPARLAASWLDKKPQARNASRAWFARHGLESVPWLAFDALGAPGPLRDAAAQALRHLAFHHGDEAVAAELSEHGEAALSALESILGPEALYALPRTMPRIPDWADPSLLPPIWERTGKAVLPARAVEHLLTMLLLSASDIPYAGLAIAIQACDPESLERFSAAIVAQWERVGREKSGAKGWVPRQAELIGATGSAPN
ncbi:hypothetical protein [Glycomyces rhizosphaerae]|uniref:Uncharacterized protein n=1 Tax=Glycomyces rhizosphaerae TaxID=2054422 RepID=A0ABV7Q1X7_9ACTN